MRDSTRILLGLSDTLYFSLYKWVTSSKLGGNLVLSHADPPGLPTDEDKNSRSPSLVL